MHVAHHWGDKMKNLCKLSLGLLVICAALIFLTSCQDGEPGSEDMIIAGEPAITAEELPEIQVPEAIPAPIPPVIAATPVVAPVETLVIPPMPMVYEPDYPTPISDPAVYAQSPFADVDVPPWLKQYVGSYGVLPSRFQDKGPFLYSFDIAPDADIFRDDDSHDHHDDDT